MYDVNELEIIGTATAAEEDELPRRLDPVYRRPSDGAVLCPIGDETFESRELAEESESWFDDCVRSGRGVRFASSIPARRDHLLIQFDAGGPPEYVPTSRSAERFARAANHAVRSAAESLRTIDTQRAESWLWYATRAEPDDPLPLLVLLPLLRRHLPAKEIELLKRDCERHSARSRTSALRRLQADPNLLSLSALLRSPRYLDERNRPLFLKRAQACLAGAL